MKKIYTGFFLGILFIICTSIMISGIDAIKKEEKQLDSKSENKEKVHKDFQLSKVDDEFKIKLYRSKEDTIINLTLEEYVLGVVSAEMPAEFPLEALKAQAIAARTYGLSHVEDFGGKSSPGAKGANLIDTVANQVYYSKEERFKGWKEEKREEYWQKLNKAVDETKGQILTYDGNLVMNPYFFSTSSGSTEEGKDVFNVDLPYLKSVESSGEEDSPKFQVNNSVSFKEVIEAINEKYENSLSEESDLEKDIKILTRTTGGAVDSIKIGKTIIKGTDFRKIFNLTSANFTIEFNDGAMIVSAKGYGHGVGMSQWGARAMANNGKNYIDILTHYYSGVEVKIVDFEKEQYKPI